MASENETIADIVALMRHDAELCYDIWLNDPNNNSQSDSICKILNSYADRIEAAWKREREPKPLTIPEWIDHEESIADIAAVLRRYVLPSLADRLDAAWKRERDCLTAMQDAAVEIAEKTRKDADRRVEDVLKVRMYHVGNAAATREALDGMCEASQDVFRSFARETFAGERRLDSLGVAFDKARAALSAPPRNCDFYDNKTDAETGFVEETGEDDRAQHYWQMFANWLFATAAERKGEGDGSK